MAQEYDVIIVGAGPAGLTAGIYTGRYGLKTAIFDKLTAGGQLALTPLIENYPGYKAIPGPELANLMKEEDLFKVTTVSLNEFTAHAIILTVGSTPKKLEVPGEKELTGRGVSYCALCDAQFFKQKRVIVVGGGNTAVVSAKYLSDLGSQVSLVHRKSTIRGEETIKKELIAKNVQFHWNSKVKEIKGENKVKSVVLDTQGHLQEVPTDGIFIHIGEIPTNGLANKLGLELDSEGFVLVNDKCETSMKGIFAAGDISGGILQVSTAVGKGTIAAVNAYLYIKGGWYCENQAETWND